MVEKKQSPARQTELTNINVKAKLIKSELSGIQEEKQERGSILKNVKNLTIDTQNVDKRKTTKVVPN